MSGGGLSLCRLCRKTCDFSINIFDPNGTNGFLVWEIIKELLQLDVCKADGLPVTICRQCMDKVTEFKYFKTMCIASRIEFLKASASRGLIDSNPCPLGDFPDVRFFLPGHRERRISDSIQSKQEKHKSQGPERKTSNASDHGDSSGGKRESDVQTGNTAKKSRGVIGRGDDNANSKNRKRPLESAANPVAKKMAPSAAAQVVVDSSVGKLGGVARDRKTSSVSEASNSISLDPSSRSERPLGGGKKCDGRTGPDGRRGGKTTPKGSASESSERRASQVRREKSQVGESDLKSRSRREDGVVGKGDSFACKATEVKKPSQDAHRSRFAFMSDGSDIISDDSSCCEVPNLSDWSSEDEEKMESEVEVLPPVEDVGKPVERESRAACAEMGRGKASETKGHAKHPVSPHVPCQPPSISGPVKKTVHHKEHKTSLDRSQSGPLSKKRTAGKTSDCEKETSVRSKHPATRACRVLVEDVLKNGTPSWLTRIGRTTYCVSLKTSPLVATEDTGDSVTNHIPEAKADAPKTETVADSVQGGAGKPSSLQRPLKAAKTKSVRGRGRIHDRKMAISTTGIYRKSVKKSRKIISSSEEENNSSDHESASEITTPSKLGLGESGVGESKTSRERSAGDVSGSESCDASLRSVPGSLKAAKTKSVRGRSRVLERKIATSTASISRKPVKKSREVVSSSEEENNSGDGGSVKNATPSKPGLGESGGGESKRSREGSAGDSPGSESCDASLRSVSRASVSSGGKGGDVSGVEAPKKLPADASPLRTPPEVSPSKLKEMAKSLGMPEVRVKLEKLPEFVVSSVGGRVRVGDGGAVEGMVGSSKGEDERCSQCGMWFPTRVLLKVHSFLEHSKAHEHHKASRLGAELSEKTEFEVHCSVALRRKKPKKWSPGRKLAKGKPADGEQPKGDPDINSGEEEKTNGMEGGEEGVDEAEGVSGIEDGEESSEGSSDGDDGSGDDSVASERSKGRKNSKEPSREGDRSECSSVGDGAGKASGESDSKIGDASETGVTSTSPPTETVSVALEQLETGDGVSNKSREHSADIGNSNSATETTEDNFESSKQSGCLGGEELQMGKGVSKTSKEPSSDIGNSNSATEITEDSVEGCKQSSSLGGDVSVALGQLETEVGVTKTSKEPSSDHGDANPASEVVEPSSKGDLETSKGLDPAPKECGEASDNLSRKKANCKSGDGLEARTIVGSSDAVLKASNKNGEDPDLLVSADKTVKNDAVNGNSKPSELSTVGSSGLKEQESTDVLASVAGTEKGGDCASSLGNSSVSEAKKGQKAMEKSEAGGSSSLVLTELNDSVLKSGRSVSSQGSKTGDSKIAESLGAKIESSSVSSGLPEKSKVGHYSRVGDVLHREIALPDVSGGSPERSKKGDSKKADDLSKEIKPSNTSDDLSEKSKAQDSKKVDSLRNEIKSSGASGDSSEKSNAQDSEKDDGLRKEIISSTTSGDSSVASKTQDSKKDNGLLKEIKSSIACGDSSQKSKARETKKGDSLSEEIKSSTRSGDSSITSNPQGSEKDNGLSKGIKSSIVSGDSSGKPKTLDSKIDDSLGKEIKSSSGSDDLSEKSKSRESKRDDGLCKEIEISSDRGDSSGKPKIGGTKKSDCLNADNKPSGASGDSSEPSETEDSKVTDGKDSEIESSSPGHDSSETPKARESQKAGVSSTEMEHSSVNSGSSKKSKTGDAEVADRLRKEVKPATISSSSREKSKSGDSKVADGVGAEITSSHLPSQAEISAEKKKVSNCIDSDAESAGKGIANRTSRGNCTAFPAIGENGVVVNKVKETCDNGVASKASGLLKTGSDAASMTSDESCLETDASVCDLVKISVQVEDSEHLQALQTECVDSNFAEGAEDASASRRSAKPPKPLVPNVAASKLESCFPPSTPR